MEDDFSHGFYFGISAGIFSKNVIKFCRNDKFIGIFVVDRPISLRDCQTVEFAQ